MTCRIRIEGGLDESWSTRLGGLGIKSLKGPGVTETVLEGIVADQAALRGVLAVLGDLNLAIISVDTMPHHEADGTR